MSGKMMEILCVSLLLFCVRGGRGQSPAFGSVRLVAVNDSTSVSSGRLEVYYSEDSSPPSWGAICSSSFEIRDADVACQELGFLYSTRVGAVAQLGFNESSGPIWFSVVECSDGDTSLADCSRLPGSACQSRFMQVAVHCSNDPDPVRLVNSQNGDFNVSVGRLEIFVGNLWGTVCGNSFDIGDANVACRQLGFPRGAVSVSKAETLRYPDGSGVIWLDDLACSSADTNNLRACNHRRTGLYVGCSHNTDVILSCLTEGSVRLVTTNSESFTQQFTPYGRLEIYIDGGWGTVCNRQGVPNITAQVVCRQLGFSYAGQVTESYDQSTFPTALTGTDIYGVNCTSADSALLSCLQPYGCGHGRDVVIYCGDFTSSDVPLPDPCSESGAIRLNGRSPVVGVVEVCLLGTWGSVCADRSGNPWTTANTQVICQQLGRQLGVEISDTLYLRNTLAEVYPVAGPVHLSIPFCRGTEAKLVDCTKGNSRYCTHSDDVAVACIPSDSNSPLLPNCTTAEFQCGNGFCVDTSKKCDEINDCGDQSDEIADGCQTLINRARFLKEIKNEGLGLTLGVSFCVVLGVVLLWVAVLVVCMLVSRCPLRQLYSQKAVVGPDSDVVRMTGGTEITGRVQT